MSTLSLTLPVSLYPAIAPLPAPMANHLLYQEARKYRRAISKRPADQEIIQTVLERIVRARIVVFEYMNPFVLADRKHQHHTFPEPDWLLDALAQYAPNKKKNDLSTLDYWQKRGLLRREKMRGLLDITSVAALLVARLSDSNLQRNWLPSSISESEPRWWCYSRSAPGEPIQAVPLPFFDPLLPASLVVWTPWQGAGWEERWQRIGEPFYQWAGAPLIRDLSLWDGEIPRKIQDIQNDPFFSRKAIQLIFLQEARQEILVRIVQKGVDRNDSIIR